MGHWVVHVIGLIVLVGANVIWIRRYSLLREDLRASLTYVGKREYLKGFIQGKKETAMEGGG
jgi:hypothetical protein